MIYLASPYSHPYEQIRHRRYIGAREFVYDALTKRIPVMSPIVYAHQFARDFGMAIDAASWMFFNEQFLILCDEVWVLRLQDWEKSVGVAQEIRMAEELDMNVTYVDPMPHADF